jgi:hypothetical protein
MNSAKSRVCIFFAAALFSISNQARAENVTVKGTDIILPTGGRVVFPDTTSLSSASEKGITTAVHGIVGPNGASSAKNCTVSHTGTGEYTIAFEASLFSSAPDCVVSSVGHVQTNTGYSSCELSNVPTTASATVSCMKYIPTLGTPPYAEEFYDTPFTFICMN